MESFFKSMKTERLYRTNFRSEREIKTAIKDYINYYNTNRPHSMLNYQTPNAYENKLAIVESKLKNVTVDKELDDTEKLAKTRELKQEKEQLQKKIDTNEDAKKKDITI